MAEFLSGKTSSLIFVIGGMFAIAFFLVVLLGPLHVKNFANSMASVALFALDVWQLATKGWTGTTITLFCAASVANVFVAAYSSDLIFQFSQFFHLPCRRFFKVESPKATQVQILVLGALFPLFLDSWGLVLASIAVRKLPAGKLTSSTTWSLMLGILGFLVSTSCLLVAVKGMQEEQKARREEEEDGLELVNRGNGNG
jgi:hypothetical protein